VSELPRRRREKRPSYGRFSSGCDDSPPVSRSNSTHSSSTDDSLSRALSQCASLQRALDKHSHLDMLINDCIKLRKMRASVSWPPLISAVDKKLASLQARLDGIELDT
jgi:hypothetical protein